jgi:regulator of RNase E activity RraA
LVKLKYTYGGFLDDIPMYSLDSHVRIFGPAVTVKMVETGDKSAPKQDKDFVDLNIEGRVIFVQQSKGLPSACWGGLMSARAQYLGAQGVVVDGRMRDIKEHKQFKFPASQEK